MVRETRNIPKKARSKYMCLKCGHVFELSEELLSEMDLVMCPRCGWPTVIKLKQKTRKIIIGV
ncbi:MAG: DNA-directed RNA polymerase subunit P [Candidatus Njordarchaeales archaeon]|nr:DNA-directed RNA polymerase subunit P [Candidatus Korarchaeota archaeon]